jgi:hypothetical protein
VRRRRYRAEGFADPPPGVGGELDWRRMADRHRPTDPRAFKGELRRLAAQGLTARDLSSMFAIDFATVTELLVQPDPTEGRYP